jgi:hypothetical protein
MGTENSIDKDAFDQWWEWATKDRATDYRTIPAEIHNAVMILTPEEQRPRHCQRGRTHADEPAAPGGECGSI